MCGIAGIFDYRSTRGAIDPALIDEMTDRLAHRGPDGRGTWIDKTIALGHRRLAIIDTSDRAAQPMRELGGNNRLTFNGEIYNYRELRAELIAKGHHFQSESDTEVLLNGYREWGTTVVDRLSGIFAFALWDSEQRCLFLARDPLGVKPLFYAEHAGRLTFASEVKSLLADRTLPRDIDAQAIDSFLTFGYLPAPATGLRAVRSLLPGHRAIVSENGLFPERYWSVPSDCERPFRGSFQEAREELTSLISASVRRQLVSDVPVGVFLSGGIDSAALLRAVTEHPEQRCQALAVRFADKAFDESERALATAEALGVDLEFEDCAIDPVDCIESVASHADEPFADSSMLAVYMLSKAARKHFTVALGGDGADELFAGYETYKATFLAGRYRKLPRWLRQSVLTPLARRIPVTDRKYSLHKRLTRFTRAAEYGAGRDHAAWRELCYADLKQSLYTEGFRERVGVHDPLLSYAEAIAMQRSSDALNKLLGADLEFYLPNDMLTKVDRMSMAHGLEVRVPLIDTEIVSFAMSLPSSMKIAPTGRRKHVLRESLRGSIPRSVLDAPKSGFNVPIERWFRESLGSYYRDLIQNEREALSPFFQIASLETLLHEHEDRRADNAHALFALLMFALWLRNLRSSS